MYQHSYFRDLQSDSQSRSFYLASRLSFEDIFTRSVDIFVILFLIQPDFLKQN